MLALRSTTSTPKQRQQILYLYIRTPLRDQSNNNTSCILALGHHLKINATTTDRTSWHCDTIPNSKQRQQVVYLSTRTPCRDQNNDNKSCILTLGHHIEIKASNDNKPFILILWQYFETKTTATNRASYKHWNTSSKTKKRNKSQSNGNKSYIVASHFTSGQKQRQQILHLSTRA